MSDFKMIPDEDELASSQRDLRFYPAEPANAKTLSSADVAEFNTAGYIRPISIFNDEEMADIRAYFDALLEKVIAEGGDSYSISTCLLYTSPSPRDQRGSRMPSSA